MSKTDIKGTVLDRNGGLYQVMLDDRQTVFCKGRGALKRDGTKLLAGDRVVLNETLDAIEEILPRKNVLIRPPTANVDRLFIVLAAKEPEPQLLTVDKLTVIAEQLGIIPVIVITKADRFPEDAEKIAAIYKKSGFDTFVCGTGMTDSIKEYIYSLEPSLSVFAGASGVGKSTLLSALFPGLELKTGELSKKISRGMHTTRLVRFFPLDSIMPGHTGGGFVADTPGFALLDFVNFDFVTKDELPYAFKEFSQFIGDCKYTKCSHQTEDGCAIIEAVEKGIIPEERHQSYRAIYADVKNKHEWDKK